MANNRLAGAVGIYARCSKAIITHVVSVAAHHEHVNVTRSNVDARKCCSLSAKLLTLLYTGRKLIQISLVSLREPLDLL